MEKIDIIKTIKDGCTLGFKNFWPLVLTSLLYVITCWIPYVNVGTTVGFYKAIIAIGKGEKIDPLAIFNKENYAYFSDFFLLMGLMCMGMIVAGLLFLAPVMAIAWMFAFFFMIDKKLPALKALNLSYKATLGEKWRILAILLLCGLAIGIATAIFAWIPYIGWLFVLAITVLSMAIMMAVESVMFNHFSKKADAIKE